MSRPSTSKRKREEIVAIEDEDDDFLHAPAKRRMTEAQALEDFLLAQIRTSELVIRSLVEEMLGHALPRPSKKLLKTTEEKAQRQAPPAQRQAPPAQPKAPPAPAPEPKVGKAKIKLDKEPELVESDDEMEIFWDDNAFRVEDAKYSPSPSFSRQSSVVEPPVVVAPIATTTTTAAVAATTTTVPQKPKTASRTPSKSKTQPEQPYSINSRVWVYQKPAADQQAELLQNLKASNFNIIDITLTSPDKKWKKFSPQYPNLMIPIYNTSVFAMTVLGIYEGLKNIAGSHDSSKLLLDGKRLVRKGTPEGWFTSFDHDVSSIIGPRLARWNYFVRPYLHVLESILAPEVKELRELIKKEKIAILDTTTSHNLDDDSTQPCSAGYLLGLFLDNAFPDLPEDD